MFDERWNSNHSPLAMFQSHDPWGGEDPPSNEDITFFGVFVAIGCLIGSAYIAYLFLL